ncbi:MAG: hypothetical protein ACTSUE_05555 [Promethearchaeota archaeon]
MTASEMPTYEVARDRKMSSQRNHDPTKGAGPRSHDGENVKE